jgi:hypothetical protein
VRLEEAVGLAIALDLEVVETTIAPLRLVTPATLFGKGKIEEFAAICEVEKIDVAVFDDQLTPVQQRNLERPEREGRRPHGPDPRDLRPPGPHPRGQAAGRAGAAGLRALAPGPHLDPP